MLRAVTITIGALVLALSAPVAAQEGEAPEPTAEQIAEARAHFERGTADYESGNYAESEAAFRAAYELTGHPDLLYNIYTAAERNGDTETAANALEGYLRDGEMNDARREALELRIERLRLRLERQAHEREQAERAAAEREAELAREQAGREEAEQQATVEREERMEGIRAGHAASDALLYAGLASAIAGGVAAVLFATFAGLSESEDQSVAERCGRDAMPARVCRARDVDDLRRWNTAADVSWIAAAGLGAVGLVLILIGETTRPSESASEPAAVRPVVGPGLAGLTLEGAW